MLSLIQVISILMGLASCGSDDVLDFKQRPNGDVVVNTSDVIASGVWGKYGINVNAGVDHDDNRAVGAQSLAAAIESIGSRRIRYPGGKKSLYFAWTADPSNPDPSTNYWRGWYASQAQTTLNFDQFMALCAETGAEPHVNVAVNPTDPDVFNETLAAEWVRYANITNSYNVKYWEIGNEMWNKRNYYGHTLDYAEIVEIVKSYSSAMKAVDPMIKVGVSWKENQAQELINECGDALDFYSISSYTSYGGSYDAYKSTENMNLLKVDETLSLNTVISEFNASLWDGSDWDAANNCGKGLINFDFIGQVLKSSKTEYACLWNTRWYPNSSGEYGGTKWDGFDNYNNHTAITQPLTLWQQFLKDNLVETSSRDKPAIVSYAAYDDNTGDLSIFLINKETSANSVTISIESKNEYNSTEIWQYKGADEWDKNTTIGKIDEASVSNNAISVDLPSTSITVFSLTKEPN